MKYQYGSEYHTDNSQKLSKYKDHLTGNLATNAALLNMVMTANKSQKGCQPHMRNLNPVQGIQSKLNPDSRWSTNDRD